MKNNLYIFKEVQGNRISLQEIPSFASLEIKIDSYTLVQGIDYIIKDNCIVFSMESNLLKNVTVQVFDDQVQTLQVEAVPDREQYVDDLSKIPSGNSIALFFKPAVQANFETIKSLLSDNGIRIGESSSLFNSSLVTSLPPISMERPPPQPIRCEFRLDTLIYGPRDIEPEYRPPFADSVPELRTPFIPYIPDDPDIIRDIPDLGGTLFFQPTGNLVPISGINIPETEPVIPPFTFSDPDQCIVNNAAQGIYIVPGDLTYAGCDLPEQVTDFYSTSWSIVASVQPPRLPSSGLCIYSEFWTYSARERNYWLNQGFTQLDKKKDHWTTWGENKWLVGGCRQIGVTGPDVVSSTCSGGLIGRIFELFS